ncbi:MAG: hypothetical protein IPP51_08355 [Bacteroidetes bacterium]|nr:hypothetical protein [Bacteroidota bacterium]
MKAITTIFAFLILAKFALANGSEYSVGGESNVSSTSIINSSDSVVFQLDQTGFTGNIIDFPVSISSDDTINAVDFSLRYNRQQFLYDTIINLSTGLQIMSYFNAADSTLRFTSNSLNPILKNTPLVSVRFRLLSGQACNIGITDVNAYLNGDLCTSQVVNCTVNAVEDITSSGKFQVFPNPVIDKLFIEGNEERAFSAGLYSLTGQKIMSVQGSSEGLFNWMLLTFRDFFVD